MRLRAQGAQGADPILGSAITAGVDSLSRAYVDLLTGAIIVLMSPNHITKDELNAYYGPFRVNFADLEPRRSDT
jgi:hypothetical protein